MKRRYSLLKKQAEESGVVINDFNVQEKFYEFSKNILVDFFEERADSVTEGILLKWTEREEEMFMRDQKEFKLKSQILAQSLSNIFNKNKSEGFKVLKKNCDSLAKSDLLHELEEQKERNVVVEASISALQIELRETLGQVNKLEKKERKRISRKKRNMLKKRQEMVSLIT